MLSREEVLALLELRGRGSCRILSDGVSSFWFDFGVRHLAALTQELVPASQNEHDEALAVRPRWHDGPCCVAENVLFEDVRIDDVVVVRSLLWFTDHVLFQTPEEALAGLPPPRNETERSLAHILAQTTGGHDEVVTNPRLISEVHAPVANLVDVGFIVVVRGRALACFAQTNAYLRQADFVDELRHDFAQSYERIPLEAAFTYATSLSGWETDARGPKA
ncbi:Hypothetical protein A7982_08793 [Minicystis rosea]|nr:Hypothetical protein A7982_08793 [Minicystis rosea]